MKENVKLGLIALGAFGLVVAANIAGEALYTNSQIGVDKKKLLTYSAFGVILTFLVLKGLKD